MSSIRNRLFCSSAGLALLISGAFLAAPVHAQQLAANQSGSDLETVVVTGTQFNPDVAPAKSSLETMEPQTIITQSYIQDSVSETADYTTILAIAPSMTGQDINGPGLSDGNVKNTLRGLPDGQFAMQYDGIPFGDTNGPSHHSESYFPGPTIGSVSVDRGPGNAGNFGASTYGGTVKLFSEVLTPDRAATGTVTYGSWATEMADFNYQSGDFGLAGVNTRVLANIDVLGSDGYLSGQNTSRQNVLLKTQSDLGSGWTLTLFADYNGLFQHVNDNNGATPAQVTAFGESFALQNTNTNLGTYQPYSTQNKKTDMDYVRLEGDIGSVHVDDQAYSYAYVNKTISTTNVEQTAADIAANTTEGLGTIVGGKAFKSDVPGYTKQNAYRVWGNIFRLSQDYDFGWLTGQVRAGIWWETQATQRSRFDYDLTQCFANNCNPWRNGQAYADTTLVAKGTAAAYSFPGINYSGVAEYVEHSNWNQYEPFVEVDLKPLENLTLTPGFKYINWSRSVAAPIEQKIAPVQAVNASNTTTRALPFFEANYKIEPSWSVYAQYAQGIYIPDISQFEGTTIGTFKVTTPTAAFPKAETTTNYQVGTVFYADNFTVDGDLYYIGVNNNEVAQACTPTGPFAGPSGETCYLNTGTAVYQGVEGEGTYAFDGMLDGLSAFASYSYNSDKSQHLYLVTAPIWTAADGLVYKWDIFKLSVIDKLVGPQYSDIANTPFYKLNTYNNTDLKLGVTLAPGWELEGGFYNIFNQRNLLAVKINDKTPIGGTSVYNVSARGSSLDQYYFAPPASFQITLKAAF
jgi:iron complex outermembrane recepter protein